MKCFILLSLVFQTIYAANGNWDHIALGADWDGTCVEGIRQSPIAVSRSRSQSDASLGNLYFRYRRDAVGVYKNNNHTVEFSIDPEKPSYLYGVGLKGRYILRNIQFHWGDGMDDVRKGAEHEVDGRSPPLEMHLVHYKEAYSDDVVLTKDDGLAVVGVLFEPIKGSYSDAVSSIGNFLMDEWYGRLDLLQTPGSEFIAEDIDLTGYIRDFEFGGIFYRYKGSLTTPECNQVVTWSVMAKILDTNEKLLKKFRNIDLKDINGKERPMANYRELQHRNGRRILNNDKT